MNVAIIGAGFAGLSAAKVLREFGHGVTVFERAPDVGGVWSATRRYPGLETQNTRDTHSLSDFPLPKHYPEWPKGALVQAYLASYVEHFALGDAIRLDCEVVSAEPTYDGWEVGAVDGATGATETARADYLVVANGSSATRSSQSSQAATATRRPAGACAIRPSFMISRTPAANTSWWSAAASPRATWRRRSPT